MGAGKSSGRNFVKKREGQSRNRKDFAVRKAFKKLLKKVKKVLDKAKQK